MNLLSALAFCRITLALIFAISAIAKASNIPLFKQTIEQFELIPRSLHTAAVAVLLGGEFATTLLLGIGGGLLWAGFALAFALCLAFTLALAAVLARGDRVACNCFGASAKPVSADDIRRNSGLILCALAGLSLLSLADQGDGGLSVAEWCLTGLAAAVFTAIWLQLGEIVRLFRHT
jgi:hypothetical protein